MVGLPALFSPELKRMLTDVGVGYAAEAIVARFFVLQYWCSAIALAHLYAEYLYFSRSVWRLNLALLIVVISLGLAGGLWAQPRMRVLHFTKYFGGTVELRAQAARSFGIWHGMSEAANLVVVGGLIWYLWRVSTEEDPPRFVSFSKMRG